MRAVSSLFVLLSLVTLPSVALAQSDPHAEPTDDFHVKMISEVLGGFASEEAADWKQATLELEQVLLAGERPTAEAVLALAQPSSSIPNVQLSEWSFYRLRGIQLLLYFGADASAEAVEEISKQPETFSKYAHQIMAWLHGLNKKDKEKIRLLALTEKVIPYVQANAPVLQPAVGIELIQVTQTSRGSGVSPNPFEKIVLSDNPHFEKEVREHLERKIKKHKSIANHSYCRNLRVEMNTADLTIQCRFEAEYEVAQGIIEKGTAKNGTSFVVRFGDGEPQFDHAAPVKVKLTTNRRSYDYDYQIDIAPIVEIFDKYADLNIDLTAPSEDKSPEVIR